MDTDVEHVGVIKEINGNSIVITINDESSCSNCSLNNICKPQDNNSREITIYAVDDIHLYTINETVKITVSFAVTKMAIIIAMVIPCIILVITIIVSNYLFNINESTSAFASLIFLGFYYTILYIKRNTLMKKYNLSIKKL